MTSWLSRLHTSIPQTANSTSHPGATSSTPLTPHTLARKSRDPNSTDYRFNINQKCIYERRLPGGSYITAHVQRLQSGYYDSPMVHEDRIENVRFVALNFVFHPAKSSSRFKSAEITVAVRRFDEDGELVSRKRGSLIGAMADKKNGDDGQRDFGTQTQRSNPVANPQSALIRSSDALPPNRMRSLRDSPPRFLRHAPHLLFGAISPETLTWNFNLAGSLGVSQGPANATLSPSGGVNGSYKLYEMMRIQGSMRGLHSWFGRQYNVEDGEIVWTLEENRLQKSGLPREFTFVMLLTKGSGGYEGVDDVKLDLDIKPVVGGFMGISNASFPGVVNNMMSYRPLHKEPVDLDLDVGQRFQPEEKGWGFNFAKLASDFDDFVWLPGKTWSTSEHGERGDASGSTGDGDEKGADGTNKKSKKDDKAPQLPMFSGGDNTLNLRVLLDHTNSRGSPAPIAASASLPYTSLRPQQPPYPHSRGPSPLHAVPAPSSSITGSQRSRQSRPSTSASHKRRSITITSSAQPRGPAHSTPTDDYRRTSRSPTLRRRTSRSSLGKEYNSPPSSQPRARPYTIHDPSLSSSSSPHAHFPTSADPARPSSWYQHDDSADDGHRPPPRTADSSASQATVVRHVTDNSNRGNALAAPGDINGDHGGAADIGRRPSAASSSGARSARSGRSEGRVSVRQAKVAQTPYPFSPTGRSAGGVEDDDDAGGDNDRLVSEDDEKQGQGQGRDRHQQQEACGPMMAAAEVPEVLPVADVPTLAVPRKSSKRASGSHLRYVVESANASRPPLPAVQSSQAAAVAARPHTIAGYDQVSNAQGQGQQKYNDPDSHERAAAAKGGVVSFDGALQGDGAGWTVDDQGRDQENDQRQRDAGGPAAATAAATSSAGNGTAAASTLPPVVNGDNTMTVEAIPAPYRETEFARSASGVFHDAAEELGDEDREGDGDDVDEEKEEKEKEKVGEGEFDRNNVF